jgi:hypothetical protein
MFMKEQALNVGEAVAGGVGSSSLSRLEHDKRIVDAPDLGHRTSDSSSSGQPPSLRPPCGPKGGDSRPSVGGEGGRGPGQEPLSCEALQI